MFGYELEADFFSFPRINAAGGRRGAAQMARLRAALYFFCFPLAAPRVASVRASPRRVRNRRAGLVGFGFERSLVSRVDPFWPDSGYYSTPSRPQRYKPIKLVVAGELVNPAGSQGLGPIGCGPHGPTESWLRVLLGPGRKPGDPLGSFAPG